MAIRNIRRQATNPLAAAGTPTSAPIYVDSDDNKLKMIPAGSGTTEVEVIDASSSQTLTNKTFTAPIINSVAAADGIVKFQPVTGSKTWVSGSPYAAFTTTQATLVGSSGMVIWNITAINATDIQMDTVVSTYAAVNKAGTTTVTHTYVSGNEAKAVSTGTLTLTCTATDSGSGLATFNITPTSSITPTTLRLSFTIFPLVGAVTVL